MCPLCKAVEPIHRAVARLIPIEQRADGIGQIEKGHAPGFLFVGCPVIDGSDRHAVHFEIRPSLCEDLAADCRTVVIVIGNLQILLAFVTRLIFVELIVLIA